MEYKIYNQARGTRIITGDEAKTRRNLLNEMIDIAERFGFEEIILPSVEQSSLYEDKAGKEILNQMYTFSDKANRELCLRPEATATIQQIAQQHWKEETKMLWYFEKCWRYERPQKGRYREFWQFGCEIINAKDKLSKQVLILMASEMIALKTQEFEINNSVRRGLGYYIEEGFEISCEQLGAQKQVCGGGRYENGIGFAIGFDRLMLCE